MRREKFFKNTENTKFSQKNGEVEIGPTFAKPASGGEKLVARTLFHFLCFWGFAKRKWVFNDNMGFRPQEMQFHEGEMMVKRLQKRGSSHQFFMSRILGGGVELSICQKWLLIATVKNS